MPATYSGLRTACNNDAELFERVRVFAGLIREDTLGYPVVIPTGSVYVTQGATRRQTGTHYTPRSLTEEIVQYTLEPLVYEGPAEGKAKEDWRLKPAAELLQLKICDIAMGSGAFLVQTCRYMAERLVEAWEQAERENPGQVVVAPEGTLSAARPDECPIPNEAEERMLVARRIVADRCLYGVDINPLAVEMAKLSLWLVTLAKGRPFTFLDHSFKCGDSLLGITRSEQIEFLNLNPDKEEVQLRTVSERWKPFVQRAITKRQELENFSVTDIADVHRKEQLFREAEEAISKVRYVGDFLVAEALAKAGKTSDLTDEEIQVLAEVVMEALDETDAEKRSREIAAILAKTERMMNLGNPANQSSRRPFHWLLEFPEVFLQEDVPKGFAAIVGNPPFQGGQKITGAIGTDYRNFLVEFLANGQRGSADLCAYFFLQANRLTHHSGGFGLVATNTIAQGDTREVGLDQLVANGCVIHRAVPSRPWIGAASLEVAHIWVRKNQWMGKFILDDNYVSGITSLLAASQKTTEKPHRLATNQEKSYIGSYVLGLGFTFLEEEALSLIKKDPKNRDVLFPYINGQDLNSTFNQAANRWVINFRDWALDAEQDDHKKPKGAPYAVDYPDCLEIVTTKVKPDRDRLATGDASARDRAKRWWQFARPTMNLYTAISGMQRVLAIALTSKTLSPVFIPSSQVIDQTAVIFTFDTLEYFALLSSSIHYWWAIKHGASLRNDARYTPSDVFETFPFPTPDSFALGTQFPNLKTIGEIYYTYRQAIMRDRQEGLTKTYNHFHDANETASDIQKLRELHIEMDQAVATAYGWQDLKLGHGFHKTKQGIRFTVSETARREVLDRLLELNHQRYAEEVAQGLHDKGKKKGKVKLTNAKNATVKLDSESEQIPLF